MLDALGFDGRLGLVDAGFNLELVKVVLERLLLSPVFCMVCWSGGLLMEELTA